eukprot:TRINITY_DN19081_c0_g1_i1.p1 TRINITY_DN19081_c0_g1~~TRINITY_DN19081_c0_g1_i1.p1  ORF type:complete len:115 (-),score=24.50 TRINITY_DN19081_c0_g1_i1:37-381(-)
MDSEEEEKIEVEAKAQFSTFLVTEFPAKDVQYAYLKLYQIITSEGRLQESHIIQIMQNDKGANLKGHDFHKPFMKEILDDCFEVLKSDPPPPKTEVNTQNEDCLLYTSPSPRDS